MSLRSTSLGHDSSGSVHSSGEGKPIDDGYHEDEEEEEEEEEEEDDIEDDPPIFSSQVAVRKQFPPAVSSEDDDEEEGEKESLPANRRSASSLAKSRIRVESAIDQRRKDKRVVAVPESAHPEQPPSPPHHCPFQPPFNDNFPPCTRKDLNGNYIYDCYLPDPAPGFHQLADFEGKVEDLRASAWRERIAGEKRIADAVLGEEGRDLGRGLVRVVGLKRKIREEEVERREGGRGKRVKIGNEGEWAKQEDDDKISQSGRGRKGQRGKSLRLPPNHWTAWPMKPEDVPREWDRRRWDQAADDKPQPQAQTSRTLTREQMAVKQVKILEEVIIATFLKQAKEAFNKRDWEDSDPEQDPDLAAGETVEAHPKKPTVMADDDLARKILKPSVGGIFGKIDALLAGLRHQRAAYAGRLIMDSEGRAFQRRRRVSRSVSRVSTRKPMTKRKKKKKKGKGKGRMKSRSRSQSRKPSSEKRGKESRFVSGRSDDDDEVEDDGSGEDRGRQRVSISTRTRSKSRASGSKAPQASHLHPHPEHEESNGSLSSPADSTFADPSSSRSSSSSSSTASHQEGPTQSLDFSDQSPSPKARPLSTSQAPSRPPRDRKREPRSLSSRAPSLASITTTGQQPNLPRVRVQPRDWRDVLGVAGMVGWDGGVIGRASERLEGLLGERMEGLGGDGFGGEEDEEDEEEDDEEDDDEEDDDEEEEDDDDEDDDDEEEEEEAGEGEEREEREEHTNDDQESDKPIRSTTTRISPNSNHSATASEESPEISDGESSDQSHNSIT